jgi:hypothetical protein
MQPLSLRDKTVKLMIPADEIQIFGFEFTGNRQALFSLLI